VELEFPIVIKNNLDAWQILGYVWLPPLGCLSVSRIAYEQNKDSFDFALQSNRIGVVQDELDGGSSDLAEEGVESKENGSVVERYVNGGLHWRTAQVEIESIDDIEVIDQLIIEAQSLGLTDGVIVRTLNKRFDELANSL